MYYKPFHSVRLGRLVDYAERILGLAIAHLRSAGQPPDKCGGYLAIVELGRGDLEMLVGLGYSSPEKVDKRMEFAIEKGKRLYGLTDFTSYESRKPEIDRWGGAVRGRELIFSFSGLPELWDEAAMFVLAIRLGQLRETDVCDVISEERNPHLRPLLGLAHWTE